MQCRSLILPAPTLILIALGGLAGCADGGDAGADDLCAQVADLVATCTGERPRDPVEGCVGGYRDSAEAALAEGCSAFSSDGKADGAWCEPGLAWTGTCAVAPVAQVGAVAPLSQACPPSRTDALCGALRAGDDAGARTAAAALLAAAPGDAARNLALTDPALHFYVRERLVALLVWNVVTDRGHGAAPADYASAASAVIAEHYPIYAADPSQLAMARRPLPPIDGAACQSQETLVYFPGVARIDDRSEFRAQFAAIKEAIPCLRTVMIETDSFVHPSENAALAYQTITALSGDQNAGLHLVGYSQGASNLLRTLSDYPDIAARARTVLTLDSAAHGSEVGDVLYQALGFLDRGAELCAALPPYAKPTCDWALEQSPVPADLLAQTIAEAMALAAAEAGTPSLPEFLERNVRGVQSLTTADAEAFWSSRGAQLPRDVLYTAFRAIITNTEQNLPPSNALFYAMLNRAGGDQPYNDMQVLLRRQTLGGPVADREVVMPVAEGNHWSWEFTEGQLDPALMPPAMTARVPQRALMAAYAELLFDLGLIR